MSLSVHSSRLKLNPLERVLNWEVLKMKQTKKDNRYHTVQNSNYLYFQKEKTKVTSYFETSSL